MSFLLRFGGALTVAAVCTFHAHAAETTIAVAANFTDAAKEIGAAWEKQSGHKVRFSFGATGGLFTQISQGAPFDAFLSADQATAKRAADEGLGVAGSQFTYAVGKLVLFGKGKDAVTGPETLKNAKFAKLALANPAGAPYGAAAIETMRKLGVYDTLQPKIVQGQNITQTFQFVETGNAEVGFIALSQIVASNDGSRWIVDPSLYAPIKQDAILLKRGEANPAGRDFVAFLKGPDAARVKEKYGYGAGM